MPGASETVSISVPAPAGPTAYYATFDPNDVIPECVDDNNVQAVSDITCDRLVK